MRVGIGGIIRWILVGAGLLGGVSAAGAAERPPFLPTRDVAVVYEVQSNQIPAGPMTGDGQGPHVVTVRYSVAAGRARLEQASMPGYMLIDPGGKRVIMVMDQLMSYMEMPLNGKTGADLLLNDRMKFVRGGTEKVAGLPCTVWNVTSGQTTAQLCITEDGVILRGEGGDSRNGRGKLMAKTVSFADQKRASFSVPPGLLRMDMPSLPSMPGGIGKPPG